MVNIGTPKSKSATKMLLLGSGELGKEVAIEAQRYGIHVMAVDKYSDAPAMHVAHESKTINMLDANELRKIVNDFEPDYIVPEIEAIATDLLIELEKEGYNIVPTARAVKLTMNREGIRKYASEELGVNTSRYLFAKNKEEFYKIVKEIGLPCVVKPVMSSSGKGQSVVKNKFEIEEAWEYAQKGGRAGEGNVIVESFIEFDYEITLLTIRHAGGTTFLDPIGHLQINGDYVESWQPQPMSESALKEAQRIAKVVTDGLGGYGLFGAEFFIKGDIVYFSEISPRPHDTGMVTLISQNLSEFALHVRAILGLPIPNIRHYGFAASCAILTEGNSEEPIYENINEALSEADTALRLFGKPEVKGKRRMGVALALGDSIEDARRKAIKVADAITIKL
ncbi:MAG: formate-dependent phosphoribosylglycinamide formyltransferase [Leptospiraceae bacterium]|nr:formate-dependent phosphoribosylglycinamide formyltransferase [Leptospiraceae bacterium]